jgi:hypothetical protein
MDTTSMDREQSTLHGTIVKRRSMGRNLAFCEILLTDAEKQIVSVAFRRDTFMGTNFPVKNSQFPYASLVDMVVQASIKSTGPSWEVLTWNVVTEQTAKELATIPNGGGICCSKYLQIRSETYREQQLAAYNSTSNPRKVPKTTIESHTKDHSQSKSLRFKIFASWLLENLLNDSNDSVLDVAGGKGELSMQLAGNNIECTVVDPVVRKRPKMKQLLKLAKPVPQFQALFFQANERILEIVKASSCLVGLHPDEPTEDIVDLALRYNKSFAVVPCCVFSSFNPHRFLKSGDFAQTYEQFLDYLLEKDGRIQRATLSFEGKNQVIFLQVTTADGDGGKSTEETPTYM